jgi:hypothetical protein
MDVGDGKMEYYQTNRATGDLTAWAPFTSKADLPRLLPSRANPPAKAVGVALLARIFDFFHSWISFGHSWISLGRSWISLGHSWISFGHSWISLGHSWKKPWALVEKEVAKVKNVD